MPRSELTLTLLDGRPAREHAAELEALHDDVYRELPYAGDLDQSRLAGRFAVQCRQPGFVLAAARSGGYLIGCATGIPLRPSTSWWRNLTAPLAEDVTAEPPGRTFALTELMVRASWRRQGLARSLHDLILSGRQEERATLVVPPAATAAQAAFQSWGWRKIARTYGAPPQAHAADLLVLDLVARRGP